MLFRSPVFQGFDVFKGFIAGNVDYHNKIDLEGYYDWSHQDKTVQEEGYVTDLINDHAIKFVEKNKNKPFFIALMHGAPHAPYQGPNDPAFRKLGTNKHPKEASLGIDTNKAFLDMMSSMDAGIGRLVNKLDELNLRQKTLIIFTSDNGPAKKGSSGELKGKKGSIYEGGHRVPTIMNWKGTIQPHVSDSVMMGTDMLPTFVALAGGKTPADKTDGISIIPALKGQKMKRELLYWGYKSSIAVRDGDWKLITDTKGKRAQLYNLKEDLQEKKDRSKDFPEKVETLKKAALKWHQEVTAGVKKLS